MVMLDYHRQSDRNHTLHHAGTGRQPVSGFTSGGHIQPGWALNVGAGLLFSVNERLELDIGCHEKRMFWESADVAGQRERLRLSTTLSQFTGAVHVLF